jgi:hypothetical protein
MDSHQGANRLAGPRCPAEPVPEVVDGVTEEDGPEAGDGCEDCADEEEGVDGVAVGFCGDDSEERECD